MNCSSVNQMVLTKESQSAADRLSQLTQDLFGTMQPEEDEFWRVKLQQAAPAQTPLKPASAAVQKWEQSATIANARTRKRQSSQRCKEGLSKRKYSPRVSISCKSSKAKCTQPSKDSGPAPSSQPTQPLLNATTTDNVLQSLSIVQLAPAPSISNQNDHNIATIDSVQIGNMGGAVLDPLTLMKEFFDSDIAPNLIAPNPGSLPVKICIYKKLFESHVANALSVHSKPIFCNDVFLITLSGLQYLGLLPS